MLLAVVIQWIGATDHGAALLAQQPTATSGQKAPEVNTLMEKQPSVEGAVEISTGMEPRADRRRYRFEKKGAIVFRKLADCEIKCDIYQPESADPMPAIIMIHGGAWRHGSKIAMIRHARRVARAGYVVASIDYRLAPKYPWPAQIEDCRYAVRWLKHNARKWNIDADRVGVFGYSAGGHLAALLGTIGEEENPAWNARNPNPPAADEMAKGEVLLKNISPTVCAVAIGGAPCEFGWLDENSNVLKYWMGGSRQRFGEKYRLASPLEYVTEGDAPFFIFHGTADRLVPLQSPADFHHALMQRGVASTFRAVNGAGHLATFSKADLLNEIIPFFDKHLGYQTPGNVTAEDK